ncbi:O-antigen ligase family protein [Prauserella oleivorans]|uniref:O-antigen ligase family protein n=1 Tax=Prauserella oleivorans TaxID=1478153 RepID=A0ABW5W2B2_9PSEU
MPAHATHPAPLARLDPESRNPPRLVGLAWGLLALNTLGSQGTTTLVTIPQEVYQLITMGSLTLAFALALLHNPRLRIRPNAYLLSLTLLLAVSTIGTAQLETGAGGVFRWCRLALFIATLWLLSRWWDGTLAFVRYHIRFLVCMLGTVVIGLVVAPGLAMPATYDGRLVGALWPLTAPQVGQYAAVAAGLTIVLWLGRRTDGRSVLFVALPAVGILLLSYTRTATLGFIAGLGAAALALLFSTKRARGFAAAGAAVAAVALVAFAPLVETWFRRGQDDENFENLTGRQKVWDALLAEPRSTVEQLFGTGLSNKSFDGLPIDSGWLAVYHEQGLVSVAIVVVFLGTLLVTTALRPPSTGRSCAVFLIAYCLVASYTEAGLGDASPYLLYLAIAASLLGPAPRTNTAAT